MANNYLITGYWGEPHVTAENDRGINAAMFGAGRFVLPVGKQFKAEYIGNNTIRMYDGKLMDNGAGAGIPAGEYIDFLISNAGQGMKRNDLIVFQYSQDASTLIETGRFIVIQGTETSETPSDPEISQEDLLTGAATFDQMALWRITVSGTDIAEPEKVFSTYTGYVNEGFSAFSESEIDNVINSAWNSMADSTTKSITLYVEGSDLPLTGGVWFIKINRSTDSYGTIDGLSYGDKGVRKTFRSKYVSWQPWEWENPPMNGWTEYRTTEKWAGKPVYTKLISYSSANDVGNAGDTYGFAIEFSTPNFFQLVRYCGTLGGNNGGSVPNFNTESGGGYLGVNYMNSGGIAIAMRKKIIPANTVLYIQVWYTKTSD